MRRYFFILIFLLARVTHAETGSSDFIPARGAMTGRGTGPWDNRLLMAWSDDGLSFTHSGQVIADQANVPDFMPMPDGRLFLYFTGGQVGTRSNETAVAISSDDGKTWIFKYLEIEGFEQGPKAGDPDIVRLPDGRLRLYITSGDRNSRYPKIFYADSQDGIHFKKQGVAFELPGKEVMDSFTVKIGAKWHMYALGRDPINLWHAISDDGMHFSLHEQASFMADGHGYIPTNEMAIAEGYRFYAFSMETGEIRSFLTKDGFSWQAEPGVRLAVDLASSKESKYVKDAAVVKLKNGKYLMVYASSIPQ